jgi:hypothetical protein
MILTNREILPNQLLLNKFINLKITINSNNIILTKNINLKLEFLAILRIYYGIMPNLLNHIIESGYFFNTENNDLTKPFGLSLD